ncbi:hypothetical protein D3C73_643320 [compost metagenome]
MVVIPLHGLLPFRRYPPHIFLRIRISISHLAPYQITQPVRPVEVTRILYLLVLARAVEAHLFGQLNVPFQILVAGRRQNPLRKIPLIQHQPHKINPVVQHQLAGFHRDFAHAEVAFCLIRLGTVHEECNGDFIQIGMLRRPPAAQAMIIKIMETDGTGFLRMVNRQGCNRPVFVLEADFDAGFRLAACRSLIQKRTDLDFIAVNIRLEFQLPDIVLRHRLQPDCLPDSGCPGVEDGSRVLLPILLPPWQGYISAEVFRAHYQKILSGLQSRRNIRLKRRMAAFVIGHLPVVNPDRSLVIYCAEVQDNPLACPFLRNRKAALVPHQIVEACIFDTAQFTLIREGDLNLAAKGVIPAAPFRSVADPLIVKFKLPGSIQMLPFCSYKLRPWILRPQGGLCHGFDIPFN